MQEDIENVSLKCHIKYVENSFYSHIAEIPLLYTSLQTLFINNTLSYILWYSYHEILVVSLGVVILSNFLHNKEA